MANAITGRGWAFPLTINLRGGVGLTGEQNEIEQAIHIILNTPLGERIMRATFGSRLHELVFEPINVQTLARARRYVEEALGMWEPRITLRNVEVLPSYASGDGCLLIHIDYEVKLTQDRRSLVYPFYLIPGP